MNNAEFNALPVTPRGFIDLLTMTDREGIQVEVRESSLACEGAHVRVFLKPTEKSRMLRLTPDAIHLNVPQAKQLRDALAVFIDAAESNLLTEPAEAPPEEEP